MPIMGLLAKTLPRALREGENKARPLYRNRDPGLNIERLPSALERKNRLLAFG